MCDTFNKWLNFEFYLCWHSIIENFRNKLIFYGEELLDPRPTPKLEDHPLWVVDNIKMDSMNWIDLAQDMDQ
jgi:hypothetical protein